MVGGGGGGMGMGMMGGVRQLMSHGRLRAVPTIPLGMGMGGGRLLMSDSAPGNMMAECRPSGGGADDGASSNPLSGGHTFLSGGQSPDDGVVSKVGCLKAECLRMPGHASACQASQAVPPMAI